MSFQIKDFLSIVASMINHMRATQDKLTDFNVGSVARTLVEAPAIELDELYQMMFRGLKEAIPVSVYNSFDFALLPAVGASGLVRFTASPLSAAPTTIPAGTVVTRSDGSAYRYVTGAYAEIPANTSHVDVLVYCETVGLATNATAGMLTVMASQIAGVTASNPSPFVNGRDIETDAERKMRFREYISTIARGTLDALRYGAGTASLIGADGDTIERVQAVSIVEPYLADPVTYPAALVWLYIHNGSGGTSAELVAEAQKVIDGYKKPDGTIVPGWKAAGVPVEVHAATDYVINVTATVDVLPGYDAAAVRSAAASAVSDYLGGLGIGEMAVRAEIVARIMAVPGVYNVNVTGPIGDVAVTASQKIMPGTVVVS